MPLHSHHKPGGREEMSDKGELSPQIDNMAQSLRLLFKKS